jgi:hypothetical protein
MVRARLLDLKKRQPQGATLLWDSIRQILVDFTELQLGDAIYVVTDGGDNRSKIPPAQLRQELIVRGVRIFAFLVGQPLTVEEGGAGRMEELAEFTGGNVVHISSAEIGANRAQLDKWAPYIVGQVEHVYRVELGISAPEKAGLVKVSFVDKGRRKKTRIVYTHQVAPCSVVGGVVK